MDQRAFILYRDVDVTGMVAHGWRWANGDATVYWLGKHNTRTWHPSMTSVIDIHCHAGKTRLLWCDDHDGVDTIPFGHGAFVWCLNAGPFGESAWLYTRKEAPFDGLEWNPREGLPYIEGLAEGDHVGALPDSAGGQVLTRAAGQDRSTFLLLLREATYLWVTRCTAETGGEPAFVKVPLRGAYAPDEDKPIKDTSHGPGYVIAVDGGGLCCRQPYPRKVLSVVKSERARLRLGFGTRDPAPAGWQWTTKTTTNGRTVVCGLEPASPAVGDRVTLRNGASGVVESIVDAFDEKALHYLKITVQCGIPHGTHITHASEIVTNRGPTPRPA